jgi:hypothetical protein
MLTATGCIVQAPPAAPAQRVADPQIAGDQVVDLRGGGYCGWIRPRGVGLSLR